MKRNKLILIVTPILLCLSGCFINKSTSKAQIKNTEEHTNNYTNSWTTIINNEIINGEVISNEVISNEVISNEANISNKNNNTNHNINDKNIELIEYENKKFQFKIGIPKDWNFKENKNWFDLILITPKNDKLNENLWIKIQEPKVKQDIETYTKKTIKELETLYEDFVNIETKKTKFNDWKSIIYEFNSNWLNIKAQQTVFLINNNAYVFTYTATKETFDKYINTVNKITDSFSLLN